MAGNVAGTVLGARVHFGSLRPLFEFDDVVWETVQAKLVNASISSF
jgi:hypothetical protein